MPATNSETITRSRESEVTTSGMTMNGWPRKIRASVRWFWRLELVVELLLDPRRISSPIALGSMPGAIRLARRRISPRFCMSARTAAATPGYWTLTATSRPSGSRGR